MTSDQFYVKYYQKEYDRFYPCLSNQVKEGIANLVSMASRSNIAPLFTTVISCLPDNNSKDVKKMLTRYDDIEYYMKSSPYYDLYKDYIKLLPQISGLIIQLIKELEENGFKEYWEKEKLPLINERCKEVSKILETYDIRDYILKYKDLSEDDIIIYISCFSNPHATRLCGNVLLVDLVYTDNFIINDVTHELFHPPYKYETAKDMIDELSNFDFVMKGFKNQNPRFAYQPISMFIEECIVEALAIHVVNSLGLEDNPYEYFKKHDEGSHVISPYLYRFLKLNDILENQTFNDYLKDFIDYLRKTV